MKKQLEDIDLYLIAGQSNAMGTSKISALTKYKCAEVFDRVLIFQEGEFTEKNRATTGLWLNNVKLGLGFTENHFGIEYGIAEILQSNYVGKVAIAKYAYGTTSLHHNWNTSYGVMPKTKEDKGFYYNEWVRSTREAILSLKANGYNPKIKMLLWMQGESDTYTTEADAANYQENLKNLIANMRLELNIPDLFVVIGGIATNPPNAPYSDLVRKGQRQFCEEDINSIYFPTEKFRLNDDLWHYDGDSAYELGISFGKLLIEKSKEIDNGDNNGFRRN